MESKGALLRLEHIDVSKFTIIGHPPVERESNRAHMDFGFGFEVDPETNVVICKFTVRGFIAKDLKDASNGVVQIFDAEINFIFIVQNIFEFIRTDDGILLMENGLLMTFISIAYSTSRGIVHERTRGYGINALPMPIVPLGNFIKLDERGFSRTESSKS